ncbi:MAG TPA: single-stranded DNA-binding protein [Acidimicrobiaceae bacterium]|nr:single-stranded DNA-binding protein [Acidimicrobiaceae bacterium]HCV35118.1 single-stranded DNA-binding protein [Acidimicrobiaceae bacterium]|tara:strand:+ start:492 stop:932 length:441 start_codon:yes stop_codon:yes gene_type:complete
MAFNNTLTIIGNVTRDPELRFTQGGHAIATFGLAWNLRKQNGEEEAMFFNVTCWRSLAENVAESITKGARVIVTGRLDHRSWENQEGEKRSAVEIQAEEIGPSLQWASAEVTRNEFRGGEGGGSATQSTAGGQAAPAPDFPDEEPF